LYRPIRCRGRSFGLTENAGHKNDGPKMTAGREMVGEKSRLSTEITL